MKCKCGIEPKIRKGAPVQKEGKAFWVQIFTCNNPECPSYGKDIGERMINIFDQSEKTEITYD